MTGVGERLEGDHVCAKHAFKEFRAAGEIAKVFRRGKRSVEEGADEYVWDALAEDLREEKKVVIVDPDDVARLVNGGDFVGISLVEGDIVYPPFFFFETVRGLADDVVEKGPYD